MGFSQRPWGVYMRMLRKTKKFFKNNFILGQKSQILTQQKNFQPQYFTSPAMLGKLTCCEAMCLLSHLFIFAWVGKLW